MKSHLEAPPLAPVRARVDISSVARDYMAAPAMSFAERKEWLNEQYTGSLFRSVYPNIQAFSEAVEIAADGIAHDEARAKLIDLPSAGEEVSRPRLRRSSARDLAPLLHDVRATGWELLEGTHDDLLQHLNYLPRISWTRTPVKGFWAQWSVSLAGKGKGKPVIYVNKVLQAPRTQVSDDLLRFLIWHEMCHHFLPMSNHNSAFRELEALWPNMVELNHELDDLTHKYDLSDVRKLSPDQGEAQ